MNKSSGYERKKEAEKLQRGETQDQRVDLAFNLASGSVEKLATVAYNVMKDAFAGIATVKAKKTPTGYFKVAMNKEGVEEKSTPQIEITVTKDFTFNIHLNDYDHYQEFYYHGSELTSTELVKEQENFKAFLLGKEMSKDSKLKKIDYYSQS